MMIVLAFLTGWLAGGLHHFPDMRVTYGHLRAYRNGWWMSIIKIFAHYYFGATVFLSPAIWWITSWTRIR